MSSGVGNRRGHSEFGEERHHSRGTLVCCHSRPSRLMTSLLMLDRYGTLAPRGGTCGWGGDLRSEGRGLKPFRRGLPAKAGEQMGRGSARPQILHFDGTIRMWELRL